MSVLSHIGVTHSIVIRTRETGESRWKLHLRQIADSNLRKQTQDWRRAIGAALKAPLDR
jgi:hypothetical protein